MQTITKKEMKKKTVADCLKHIYNDEVAATAIHEMPKEALADFILQVFNKGLLNKYLDLK